MKFNRIMTIVFVLGLVFGVSGMAGAQELNLRDYNALIVKDLEVPSGSPAPESAGVQMAEKAIYQLNRYSEKYKLFDTIVKEGSKGGKDVPLFREASTPARLLLRPVTSLLTRRAEKWFMRPA